MKFGLGYLTTQIPPADSRTDFGRFQETIELVQVAERVGFDSVWVSEEHGTDDGYLSSLFPMCAAIAQATSRVTIGTAVALAPFYEPIRLAEDAAMVDVISGGRFQLGLGLGYRDWEFDWFDVPKAERVPRTVDCTDFCRRAWTGDRFSFDGRVFEYEDVMTTPRPLQGADLPILYGSVAEPAVRRAARIADGLVVTHTQPIEDIETRLSWCRAEGADPDSFETVLVREVSVGDSREAAWERMKPGSFYVAERYADEYRRSSEPGEYPDPAGDDGARSWAIYGDPAAVADEIQEFAHLLGPDDHFVARLEFPGMDHDVAIEAVERFGREVIPRVRRAVE